MQIKFIFLLFICISPLPAFAQYFISGGLHARVVQDEEGNQKIRVPISVYGGRLILPWAYSGEILYYQNKTESSSSFKITDNHYELGGYVLRFFDYQEARAVNYYASAGLGFFQSRITTSFNGVEDKDTSKLNPVAKLGGGIWVQFLSNAYINLELKLAASKEFNPDLLYEAAFRFGTKF